MLNLLSYLAKFLSYFPFLGFLPSIGKMLVSVFENVMPFIGQVLGGLSWFAKTMWEGFKDVVDDARTIVFVLVVVVGASFYTHVTQDRACNYEITEIKKKLVPKNPVRTVPNTEFKWPWEEFFK